MCVDMFLEWFYGSYAVSKCGYVWVGGRVCDESQCEVLDWFCLGDGAPSGGGVGDRGANEEFVKG